MKFFVRHYSKLVPVEPDFFAAAAALVTSYTQHTVDLPTIAIDFSWFLSKVSAKCLSIQKLNLGKVCLKVVVKVALSLQRLASTRQVKISNHTMIVRSQLIATEEATQYVRRTNS